MKRVVSLIVLLAVVFFFSYMVFKPASQRTSLPATSALAPDFTLKDISGQEMTLSSLRGKVVVLNFWASWCPPCREEMPSMEELHQTMQGKEFVLLAVNIEAGGAQAVRPFLQSQQLTFPVLLDQTGEVRGRYGVSKYPETFIINPAGEIVEKVVGGIDWSQPRVVQFLRQLLVVPAR